MRLYLIRHTKPAVAPDVCYGQSDIGVADSFAEDLAAVKQKATDIIPAICYTSPLQRCLKLAGGLGLPNLRIDPRLQELNFGQWELKKWLDIPRPELDAWSMNYTAIAPPGGETFLDLERRTAGFLRDVKNRHLEGSVLVVAHGGVIRCMLALELKLPLAETFNLKLDYGGLTCLHLEPTASTLAFINR